MDVKEATELDIRQNPDKYMSEFGTDEYLCMYAFFDLVPAVDFIIDNLLRILSEHRSRLGHDRALEFGAGPSLLPSFILAQQVKAIRFSDYVPSNLVAVEDWMKGKPDAHDWKDLFDHIIEKYQEQTGDLSVKRVEWEQNLKQALEQGGLSKCDANAIDCPILSGQPDQYDIVLSSMCLEEACRTLDNYKKTLKRLHRLMKKDALIILIHGRNQTYYVQNNYHHFTIPLNEENVTETLHEAGFVDVEIKTCVMETNRVADVDGVMTITAHKL